MAVTVSVLVIPTDLNHHPLKSAIAEFLAFLGCSDIRAGEAAYDRLPGRQNLQVAEIIT
jgi:hypothetical protein